MGLKLGTVEDMLASACAERNVSIVMVDPPKDLPRDGLIKIFEALQTVLDCQANPAQKEPWLFVSYSPRRSGPSWPPALLSESSWQELTFTQVRLQLTSFESLQINKKNFDSSTSLTISASDTTVNA